jgi:hypothetical protein
MMNKKQKFDSRINESADSREILFYPILMHFAARFNHKSYGEFASDHKILVDSNIRCLEYFDMDMVSLISDPFRETLTCYYRSIRKKRNEMERRRKKTP